MWERDSHLLPPLSLPSSHFLVSHSLSHHNHSLTKAYICRKETTLAEPCCTEKLQPALHWELQPPFSMSMNHSQDSAPVVLQLLGHTDLFEKASDTLPSDIPLNTQYCIQFQVVHWAPQAHSWCPRDVLGIQCQTFPYLVLFSPLLWTHQGEVSQTVLKETGKLLHHHF